MSTPVQKAKPRTSNPAMNRALKMQQRGEFAPGAPMTATDVINPLIANFVIILAIAAVAWALNNTILLWVGVLGGLALGLVNSFKRVPSPPLILTYAGFQGLAVGSLSVFFESRFPGVVSQAILATFSVAAVVFILFKTTKLRATAGMQRFFLVAISGYLLFSLINLALTFTGVINSPWGALTSVKFFGIPLGIIVGIFAILLASMSLLIDFTQIEEAINGGAPQKMGWYFAFAVTVTLVWLYLEMLRVLAISRN